MLSWRHGRYYFGISIIDNFFRLLFTFNEKCVICLNGDRRWFGKRVKNSIKSCIVWRVLLNKSVRIVWVRIANTDNIRPRARLATARLNKITFQSPLAYVFINTFVLNYFGRLNLMYNLNNNWIKTTLTVSYFRAFFSCQTLGKKLVNWSLTLYLNTLLLSN